MYYRTKSAVIIEGHVILSKAKDPNTASTTASVSGSPPDVLCPKAKRATRFWPRVVTTRQSHTDDVERNKNREQERKSKNKIPISGTNRVAADAFLRPAAQKYRAAVLSQRPVILSEVFAAKRTNTQSKDPYALSRTPQEILPHGPSC